MLTAMGQYCVSTSPLQRAYTDLCLYSYDAQVCYCGEHSCLGTIGGKTQTDIRIMDPLYIEGTKSSVSLDVLRLMSLCPPAQRWVYIISQSSVVLGVPKSESYERWRISTWLVKTVQ